VPDSGACAASGESSSFFKATPGSDCLVRLGVCCLGESDSWFKCWFPPFPGGNN
jgi:hypothetical protein